MVRKKKQNDPEKGWFKCPNCGREHYFDGTWQALCDFDIFNVYSTSTMNPDISSRHIPRCSCGSMYPDAGYKMHKIEKKALDVMKPYIVQKESLIWTEGAAIIINNVTNENLPEIKIVPEEGYWSIYIDDSDLDDMEDNITNWREILRIPV